MHTYAQTEELIFDKLSDKTSDDEMLSIGRMNEAVSAWIDAYCKRPDGYFLAAASTATPRRFRGTGRNFLQIPAHVAGSVSVQGVPAGDYYESDKKGYLYKTTEGGIWGECLFIVSARWGFVETPAPIVEAVKQIVARFQQQGNGILGQISINGFFIERDAPPSAKALLAPYIKGEFEV